MASASTQPSAARIGVMLTVGVVFHVGVYVLNDIVDVDLCLLAAFVVPPAAVNETAVVFTVAATAGLAIYDIFGKRFPFRPLAV